MTDLIALLAYALAFIAMAYFIIEFLMAGGRMRKALSGLFHR